MKHYLYITLLLLFVSGAKAKQYHPLAADSSLWKEVKIVPFGLDTNYANLILGDTSVSGKTYFKLFRLIFNSFSNPAVVSQRLIALIREEDKKVYLMPINSTICRCPLGEESMIYDFNVTEGDTVYSFLRQPDTMLPPFYVVSRLDTGNFMWGTYITHQVGGTDGEIILHGVGSQSGLLTCISGLSAFNYTSMMSFQRGDSIRYAYFPLSAGSSLNKRNLRVFPNPASDAIRISFEATPGSRLRLISITGQLLKEYRPDVTQTEHLIEIGDYAPGMYLLQLWENGQLRALERVIRL